MKSLKEKLEENSKNFWDSSLMPKSHFESPTDKEIEQDGLGALDPYEIRHAEEVRESDEYDRRTIHQS